MIPRRDDSSTPVLAPLESRALRHRSERHASRTKACHAAAAGFRVLLTGGALSRRRSRYLQGATECGRSQRSRPLCSRRLQRAAATAERSPAPPRRRVHARRRLAELQPRSRRHALLAATAISPTNVDELRQAWSYPLGSLQAPARRLRADAARRRRGPVRDRRGSRRRAARGYRRRGLAVRVPQGAPSQRGLAYWPGDAARARAHLLHGRTLARGARCSDGQKALAFGNAGEVPMPAAYTGAPTRFEDLSSSARTARRAACARMTRAAAKSAGVSRCADAAASGVLADRRRRSRAALRRVRGTGARRLLRRRACRRRIRI